MKNQWKRTDDTNNFWSVVFYAAQLLLLCSSDSHYSTSWRKSRATYIATMISFYAREWISAFLTSDATEWWQKYLICKLPQLWILFPALLSDLISHNLKHIALPNSIDTFLWRKVFSRSSNLTVRKLLDTNYSLVILVIMMLIICVGITQ